MHQAIFDDFLLLFLTLLLFSGILLRSLVKGVTMYSWLVTMLLLKSAAYCSGGQGAVGVGGGSE